jgi:hypothetical protein
VRLNSCRPNPSWHGLRCLSLLGHYRPPAFTN